MLLPIGDSPNLPKTPWLTYGLIVLNVAVYLALLPLSFEAIEANDPVTHEFLRVLQAERGVSVEQMATLTRGDVLRYQWGFRPSEMGWLTALTAMFLHGGLGHLLGNMLFLWIFGDNIEHRLGRLGFLAAYLGTGFLATFGDALLRWGSSVPTVGASGAISGVLGLYFVLYPHNRVRVFVFLFPFWVDVIQLSARWVLGFYLVIDNLLPLLLTAGAGGVSYGAHIGGFVAGWALARNWGALEGLFRPTPRPSASAPGRTAADRGTPDSPGQAFRRAVEGRQLDPALALLFRLPRAIARRELAAGDKVALGRLLAADGRPKDALATFQRTLADHPVATERTDAHLGAATVLLRGLGEPTAAYQHLYSAIEENPTPAQADYARALLEELRNDVRTVPHW